MNINKPIATAKQLYGLLDGVARSLQNCQPEGDSVVESSLKTRVVNDVLMILETGEYPVTVFRIIPEGRRVDGCLSFLIEEKLSTMFNEGDYDSVITAIQSILTEDN